MIQAVSSTMLLMVGSLAQEQHGTAWHSAVNITLHEVRFTCPCADLLPPSPMWKICGVFTDVAAWTAGTGHLRTQRCSQPVR